MSFTHNVSSFFGSFSSIFHKQDSLTMFHQSSFISSFKKEYKVIIFLHNLYLNPKHSFRFIFIRIYDISFKIFLHNFRSSSLFKSKTFFQFIFIHIHAGPSRFSFKKEYKVTTFLHHLYLNPKHSFDSSSFTSLMIFLQERNSNEERSEMFPFSCLFLLIYILCNIAPFIFLQERNSKEERSEMFPFSCLFLSIHIFSDIAQFIFLQERNSKRRAKRDVSLLIFVSLDSYLMSYIVVSKSIFDQILGFSE